MRTYLGRAFRKLGDGSIELEGVWAGVSPIALLTAVGLGLLLLLRSRILLVPAVGFSLYLLVLPTRRRVRFDRKRRALVVEHAGPFQEPWRRTIPFADLRGVSLTSAGRRAGRPAARLWARAPGEEIYLLDLHRGEVEAGVAEAIDAVISAR
jgi:hypothetical protein